MESNNTLTAEFTDQLNTHIKPISFWGGIGLALVFVVIQFLTIIPVMVGAMVIYGADIFSGMDDNSVPIEILMGLGLPLAFIAGAWFLSWWRGLSNTAYEWKSNFIPLTIVGLILTYSVNYIVGAMITYLPGYEGMMESYKAMFEDIDPMDLVLTVAIIGPICEEIIFRGVILEGMLKKYDTTKAILFSSLIFSVIHLQPLQVIATFFIGLILGWIYVKTQSLWVCIGIHIVNNLVAVLTMDNSSMDNPTAVFDSNLLFLGSLVAAAGIGYLAYIGLKRMLDQDRV